MPVVPEKRSTATRRLFERAIATGDLAVTDTVLVVGSSDFERNFFATFGFANVHFSTHLDDPPALAQSLPFASDSFDIVFTEAVLHHLDRPHAAIYEMVRVSRRSIIISESQENFLAKSLMNFGLMEEYERSAVMAHDGCSGGVNDSALPNFIYRWRKDELEKCFRSLDASRNPWIRCEYAWEPYEHGGVFGRLVSSLGNKFLRRAGNTFALHYDKLRGSKHPWIK
ncbi:hypothetical protein AYO41_01650 [Verrucomicrobia bacterium SCGC AG-212-E04]|nr:hypothetical protein AYO41_01650 [Verrucomicrobia bacterium SCGC AG-212-E04]